MQHPHTFQGYTDSIRDHRLIAFAGERPAETQSAPEAKAELPLPASVTDTEARQSQRREQRNTRIRRETWERFCEELPDEQLLQTLGDLHIKAEEGWDRVHGSNDKAPEGQLAQTVDLIEEQLAGAREVWADRRHGTQTTAELKQEVESLQMQRTTARERFEQFPTESARYADERLKAAIVEEQALIAESVPRLDK